MKKGMNRSRLFVESELFEELFNNFNFENVIESVL